MISAKNLCKTGLQSKVGAILGAQWGDEGKGKLVDILSKDYNYVCRFNGGANAGHTVVADGRKYAFHLLPCGILYPGVMNVIGNGTVVSLPTLFEELAQLDRNKVDYSNRLLISDRAHVVVQAELQADAKNESDPTKTKIGTTMKGIGPTYAAKVNRIGIRVGDLVDWEGDFLVKYHKLNDIYERQYDIQVDRKAELIGLKELRDRVLAANMIRETISILSKAYAEQQRILFEGANATLLDIDFGTYPYVTSSTTSIGGIATGCGFPPTRIETAIGIVKAYTTRVGEGPFPTELHDELGESIRKNGHEFGSTTGRPRRCGWLDVPVVRYSQMINGFTSLNITKLDILSGVDKIKIGVSYSLNGKTIDYMPADLRTFSQVKVNYEEFPGWKQDLSQVREYKDLPSEARHYLESIEKLTNVPVSWVGVGPQREAILLKH